MNKREYTLYYNFKILCANLIVIVFIAGCGGDNSTGPDPEPEPKPQPGVISGSVTATDGGGIEGALLKLMDNESVSQETFSNESGSFNFKSVEAGQYQVKLILPQGYREGGSTTKTVHAEGGANVEFEGEPIKEETATVKAGTQDTVATSSGAFVAVDASSASSDIEVTIEETEDKSDGEENGTQPFKVYIRPEGASKSSTSSVQGMAKSTANNVATSVSVMIGQKVINSNLNSLKFEITHKNSTIPFFADAKIQEITDQITGVKLNYFIHEIDLPVISETEFFASMTKVDNTCKNSLRELKEYSSDDSGKIPLILIHGLQTHKGTCKEFADFESLNLSDGDREDTFDYLVEKLKSNIDIDFDYKFYTYKYPSNAPIKEASDELWNLIDEKNINNPVLLAHSMGGVVARKLLIDQGEDKVRSLITLGTPHEGTPIVNGLLNTDQLLKNCPDNKQPLGCAIADIAQLFKARIVPNTPGLRDLKESESGNLINELENEQGNSDKIFTLGGSLGGLSAISDLGNISSGALKYQATYELGYLLMKASGKKNDGLVPRSSALPEWSTKIATLEDHDHTEMVRGENYDEISSNSVYNKIAPLLVRLSGDNFFGKSPSINSTNSTPNPSTPGEIVNFSADISGDEPINCNWDFGNGATSTTCDASYTYQNTGTFDVTLKANNDAGTADTTFIHTVEQTDQLNENFYLADNGITVKCEDAKIGESGTVNGVTYTKRTRDQITTSNAATTCTSGITDMRSLFAWASDFNKDISSWDVSNVTKIRNMFAGASSFNQPIGNWNVSNVTNMNEMFLGATAFNQDISDWDVSGVADMGSMFADASSFNQPIGNWNVSNVTNMIQMFGEATAFNQDIDDWDVSSVTEMGGMFSGASSFNQPIGNWDVSNVTDMKSLFSGASDFNEDISRWDVSNVIYMMDMFNGAISFNQDISGWNVGNVKSMWAMFAGASAFNQDISGWDVSSVHAMPYIFSSAISFNQDISSWDVRNVEDMEAMFDGAKSFNQDISNWCVEKILSEPGSFSSDSPLQEDYKPIWGTCPE